MRRNATERDTKQPTGKEINNVATSITIDNIPRQSRIVPYKYHRKEYCCGAVFYLDVLQSLVLEFDTNVERLVDANNGWNCCIVRGVGKQLVDVVLAFVPGNGRPAA
jgi:hypothetical protein